MNVFDGGYLRRWIFAAVDICSGGYLRRWISAAVDIFGGGYLWRWISAAVDILPGGVRDVVSAKEFWTQSKGGCAIFWTAAIKGAIKGVKGGVRDIVCAGGCWIAAIKEAGRGILSARSSARFKGRVRVIVCAGKGVDCCNQSGRPQGALDCCNQKGGGLRDAGGRGLLQSKGGCTISSGALDCCNQSCCNQRVRDIVCAAAAIKGGGARYRLRGGCAGDLQ